MRRTSDLVMAIVLFVLTTALLVWLAVWIAPIFAPEGLSATLENFERAKMHPFALEWTDRTPKYIMGALIIAFLTGIFVYSTRTHTRNGKEQGSAHLNSARAIGRYLRDKDFHKNRILSKNIRVSITGRKAPVPSLNTMVIGGMGSGKSFFLVLPNLLQGNTSVVVTDPARQLVKSTGWYRKHIAKNRVVVLDLENPEISTKYNFFEYIHRELDIEKTVQMLFKSTVEKERRLGSNSDPMWELMAQDMLYSYIALIWLRGFDYEQNISTLVYLMEEDFLLQDSNGKRVITPVMQMFEQLDRDMPNNVATRKYKSATEGEVVTIRGVKSTLRGRIGKFLLPSIQELMSKDEMHLERIGKEPTTVYLCVPNEDHSFNFIVSLFYSQLFNELYVDAKASEGEHLQIPVQFFMDEMANFAVPDEFDNYLTTGRKHWMSYMMFFQEKGQIDSMFDKKASVVIGTCNTFVYLGDSGHETNKYLSEWIGDETIDTVSYTRSYKSGGSRNINRSKRALFFANEMDTEIPPNECLVYTSRKGWAQDLKYNPKQHKNFKYSSFG